MGSHRVGHDWSDLAAAAAAAAEHDSLFCERVGVEHGARVFLHEWSFASLAVPGFFLACLCSITLAPSEHCHGRQPWSFPWRLTPKGLSLHSQPRLAVDRREHVSCFLAGKCHSVWSLRWILAVLPLEHVSRCTPLWDSEVPPDPACEGVS